ncbi:MAG TPA: cation:proton antiporter [Bryobacteraceae bacterium]|nr:cation:proton antiporter [Bryobacteraceae bacterium]
MSLRAEHDFETLAMHLWFLLVGLVLLGMALTGSFVRRLPLSTAIIYVGIGLAIGPHGLALITVSPFDSAHLIEAITEIAIIISLFGAGLKLRVPPRDGRWLVPFRLAFLSMAVTVTAIAIIGVLLLHLPVGAAIVLGGILAPTDPVLAADVQVEQPFSYNPLRFGLTGEAGLNDGTAMPVVLLGLGLLGLHDIGPHAMRWVFLDLIWKTAGGLAIGMLLGYVVARLVLHLRREHREAVGLDDFLALGLIALSYGCAELCAANGFLAVFAAGVALRREERNETGKEFPGQAAASIGFAPGWRTEAATNPETAPVYMAQTLLHFNQHLENVGELVVVVLVGSMLWNGTLSASHLWFVLLLFLVIRPISVEIGLLGTQVRGLERRLMSWFGVRGIGSVFYLSFAIAHGLPRDIAARNAQLTFTVIVASVLAHGISVTPVMNWYERRTERAGGSETED